MKAKALTVWEPWASAIALGMKPVENRSWSTHHRGRLFIHAAARPATQNDVDQVAWLSGETEIPVRPGMVVCSVELYDVCEPGDCRCRSTWAERGMYHWRLRDPVAIVQDWPVRGRQGLWTLQAKGEVA